MMETPRCLIGCLLSWVVKFVAKFLMFAVVYSDFWWLVSGLGSMSSIAVSYGESGPVFCGLKSDGSHLAACYGANAAIVYGTPTHLSFMGLTGGDGFVCGLLMDSYQPYCWGNSGFVRMGVPQPMNLGARYVEISAGDNHLCGLRTPLTGDLRNTSLVDCWGYNMTSNFAFNGQIKSISSGSEFNCGLFAENRTVFCWGDEISSPVISLLPKSSRFQMIAAGGYHVCGILEGVDSRAFCWGRSLGVEDAIPAAYSEKGSVDNPPKDSLISITGGKFHACGIKGLDRGVICWGFTMHKSTLPPGDGKVYTIAAGDYFACGILIEKSLTPMCWGYGFPASLPVAVSPGLCNSAPCTAGYYEFKPGQAACRAPNSHICLRCLNNCPKEMYLKDGCTQQSDIQSCAYNCSSCVSSECFSNCSSSSSSGAFGGKKNVKFWAIQLPIIVAEVFCCLLGYNSVFIGNSICSIQASKLSMLSK